MSIKCDNPKPNLTKFNNSSLLHNPPIPLISQKLTYNFLCYPTNKQTNGGENSVSAKMADVKSK